MKLRNTHVVLIAIVIAQFLCVSLWFAGNGVLDGLVRDFALPKSVLGHLTTAIQLGFIAGTLVFASLRIVDRYSPSHVFLWSALAGAAANLASILDTNTLVSLLLLRFATGFFLAGIYPVGMKIASDYYEKGLGKAMGYLLGALALGTALPHFLRALSSDVNWREVLIWISALAVFGGLLIGLLVPNGPYRRPGMSVDLAEMMRPFRVRAFRQAALGYFGHMWELYALWAFVPVMVVYTQRFQAQPMDVSMLSFSIIAIGGIGCVINGYLSWYFGARITAKVALGISGVCCLVSPLVLQSGSQLVLILFLLLWGMSVIADSPMLSTLVALEAPAESRGTAITIVVCIGFAITIVSIQLLNWMQHVVGTQYLFLVLAPGPVLGLLAMSKKKLHDKVNV